MKKDIKPVWQNYREWEEFEHKHFDENGEYIEEEDE